MQLQRQLWRKDELVVIMASLTLDSSGWHGLPLATLARLDSGLSVVVMKSLADSELTRESQGGFM